MQLTPQGEAMFERIFPPRLAHMQKAFEELSAEELVVMETSMRRLREAFAAALTRLDKAP